MRLYNFEVRQSPIVDTRFSVKCDAELPSHQLKDLTGNAFNARILGALAAFMLANIAPRELGTPEYPLPLDADEDSGAEGDVDTSPKTPPRKKAKL